MTGSAYILIAVIIIIYRYIFCLFSLLSYILWV